MIEWERRVRLRHYLEEGLSQQAIAKKLGISRRTVRRWIESGQLDRDLDEPPRYGPRPPVPTKLDPYKSIINERLEAFPDLSAVRLFEEVQAAGYPGGYTQVKEYVRTVRPRPEPEDANRFETPAGKQGQVDFAHFKLPWGRRYALLVVLCWARHQWVRFYRRQDMQTLMRGLEAAFSAFGGVPRELLFDQMRAVVSRDLRQERGALVENAEFLRFAHHWEFRVRVCRPYRARTKGKVERPIRYLRENFFYGRSFVSDDDLNHQVQHWLDTVANVRTHGTTGERPVDRLQRERPSLGPLALRPYRSLVLPPPPRSPSSVTPLVPRVGVEQRSLESYARIAAGGGR